jgi:flagellar biosynthesis/type III secretory pathway chaperone
MDTKLKQSLDNLVEHLQNMRELYEQIEQTANNKLKMMRSGDINGMESCTAREQFLTEQVSAIETSRKKTLQQIATVLGLAQTPKITALAQEVEEPYQSRLMVLVQEVRQIAEKVRKINQVNAAVTHEVINCFAQVQKKIKAQYCNIGLYDYTGHMRMTKNVNLLDAVG